MRTIYSAIILLLFHCSCSVSNAYTDSMKNELKEMYNKDQNFQEWDSARLADPKYTDSMRVEMDNLIRKNCEVIKHYYEIHGFPYLKRNEEKTAMYFWLLTLHSDHDIKFQQQILREMKKGIRNDDVSKQNYAYLYDRVQKNKNRPQLYGTQVEYLGWNVVPYKLKYPSKIEKLRKEVGLDSLTTYLASFHN